MLLQASCMLLNAHPSGYADAWQLRRLALLDAEICSSLMACSLFEECWVLSSGMSCVVCAFCFMGINGGLDRRRFDL